MNQSFWAKKRVLITGNTGFKGAWLCKWLDMLGAHTLGYALAPDAQSLYPQIDFSQRHRYVAADIRDPIRLAAEVQAFQPEIVLHLAAQAIVREAALQPVDTIAVNVMGTAYLLDVLRTVPCLRSVVVVTSDKVYENLEVLRPYQEQDRLGADEPYSASKTCQEMVTETFRKTYFDPKRVGIATARASNVFGGGDLHFDRLIPYLMRSKLQGSAPALRNPDAVRPWQYVLGPLDGYLQLAKMLYHAPEKFSSAWNFGPPVEELYTVGEIYKLLLGQSACTTAKGSSFYEAGLLLIDSEKSRSQLNWTARVSLRAGMERTLRFYKQHLEGASASRLMEEEIHGYHRLLEGDQIE